MSAPHHRHSGIGPQEAIKLFRVPPTASLRELNHAYRRLVKKYHPDYNAERTRWAHNAMTKINAAYDVAVDYLAALRYEEVEARLDETIREHDAFSDVFDNIVDGIVDGVFVYYQYGLENHHLRHEGPTRRRYRIAIRRVEAGLEQLRRLTPPNAIDQETLGIFIDFSTAFLQCMRVGRQPQAGADSEEQKAYRHYRAGSQYLDLTIRRTFFRDELARAGERAVPHGLPVSHDEFMTVLTKYSNSSWLPETALKIYLIDVFGKLMAISERIPALRDAQ